MHGNALQFLPNDGKNPRPEGLKVLQRVRVKYRGGPNFSSEYYLENGLEAFKYTWEHSNPPDEADIMEYALIK